MIGATKPNIDQIVAHTRYVIAENTIARESGLRGLRMILADLRVRWSCSEGELQPIVDLICELESPPGKPKPPMYLVI